MSFTQLVNSGEVTSVQLSPSFVERNNLFPQVPASKFPKPEIPIDVIWRSLKPEFIDFQVDPLSEDRMTPLLEVPKNNRPLELTVRSYISVSLVSGNTLINDQFEPPFEELHSSGPQITNM
jgi:hypothetical protein